MNLLALLLAFPSLKANIDVWFAFVRGSLCLHVIESCLKYFRAC